MLKEFKRDSARKELEQLQQLMAEKKQTLQDLKAKEEQSQEVLRTARDLGVTKEEVRSYLGRTRSHVSAIRAGCTVFEPLHGVLC